VRSRWLPADRQAAHDFRLLYRCESCAHVDPETERCSLEYPNDDHKGDPSGDEIVFCKAFELA
jgi:hypothetical protein